MIKALCEQVNPNYTFEFENDFMMNVKADNDKFPVVYFEEYTEGRYIAQYGLRKTAMVELHLYKLVPMHCSATVREVAREEIEQEFILPFIDALRNSHDFDDVTEISFFPEPVMFDANVTGVMLRFWVTFNIC